MVDALTPAKREKVNTFISVTNESNTNTAISLLNDSGWEVDSAIATYFAIHSAGQDGSGSPPIRQPAPTARSSPPPQAQPQPQPQPPSRVTGSTSASSFMNAGRPQTMNSASATANAASTSNSARAGISTPATPASAASPTSMSTSPPATATDASPNSGGRWGLGALRSVGGALKNALWGSKSNNGAASSSSSSASSTPKTPQESFLADFAKEYGPFVPDFMTGTYNDAVKEAKARGRLLFIYLHCSTHGDTDTFVRETLCTEQICNFLRENYVSWAGTIKHTDAYRLCQQFSVSTFPFIAILAPQSNSSTVAVVLRHSGLIKGDALIEKLLQHTEMYQQVNEHVQATRTAETTQRDQARSLREQQDMEYEESLLMDQGLKEAKEREEREMAELLRQSREAEEAAEQERQRQAQIEAERQARLEAERQAAAAALPPEPAGMTEGVVNISFRLPHAKKVSRRFLDSQTVGVVQQYLQSLDEMASYGTKYRILSNFPRAVHEDPTATLASLKLGKQIQLIVESTSEEEE